MRQESQAPRNSRELAVRNQFFTPRYVVEFLTDNTLGRIWHEMRKGDTGLVGECEYLVRRPSEVFLSESQDTPVKDGDGDVDLTQEELLKETVYIPHRAKKDPRDIKILDPACGSGHFLLYAFDLLISIYDEAWHDKASPKSDVSGHQLREDYPEREQLRAALPGLILANNLHGIDIDPRAAQIAALALWMRGQRAFNEFQITRGQRPPIARSNIVCAEAMPGEMAFLDEFIAEHLSNDAEGRFLASLVRKVFEAMELAGEAGFLLKIEEDIAEEVAKAKRQWLERPEYKQKTLFDAGPTTVQTELDLTRGIRDELFWEEAEQRIYDALRAYSEQADRSGGFQRRLFATDAARGFGLVDILRKRFDAALMNPPFGECSCGIETPMRERFGSLANDIYVLFVTRGLELLAEHGKLGAISSRGFMAGRDQRDFRPLLLSNDGYGCLTLFVDLGHDILDDAIVETCCYTISAEKDRRDQIIAFQDLRGVPRDSIYDFSSHLFNAPVVFKQAHSFLSLPNTPILYTASQRELRDLGSGLSIDPDFGRVTKGLNTGDNERFMRLIWEVPFEELNNRWRFCAKGGEYRWFITNIITVIDWHMNGNLLVEYTATKSSNTAQARRSSRYYFKPATTYTIRSIFSLRALPAGCIFTNGGPIIAPTDKDEIPVVLAAFASERYAGLLKQVEKSLKYETGRMGKLPVPTVKDRTLFDERWDNLMQFLLARESRVETSPYFVGISELRQLEEPDYDTLFSQIMSTVECVDGNPCAEFIAGATADYCKRFGSPLGKQHHLLSYAIGIVFGRFGQCENSLLCTDPLMPLMDQFKGIKAALDDSTACRFPEGIVAHCKKAQGESPLTSAIVDVISSMIGTEEDASQWLSDHFGESGPVEILLRGNGFFETHIKEYSGAFRRAPIYWQLGTSSGTFAVWLYYHRLTKDSLFRVASLLQDWIRAGRQRLERLRVEGGDDPTRSQRKDIEDQDKHFTELSTMAEEVERIAPLWNPSLNDGVIINFAPLWRLVPQNKAWQKECKTCWDKLVKGEYDWTHLAMHLWPERVVPKCVTDASFAIAHGLEEVFWEQDDRDRFQPKEEPAGGWAPVIKTLVDERTSPAVKAALESLLTAPAPAGNSKSRRRKATT